MTVGELIQALQQHDPNALAITSGYEGGVTTITNTSAATVALNVNTEWYYGEHELVDDHDDYPDHQHQPAVHIC